MSTKLSEAMEMYLKNIYQLQNLQGAAKPRDIARRMEVKMASVTNALQKLSGLGHINYEPYGVVTLTEQGKGIATRILRKFSVIHDFFVDVLKIDEDIAARDACVMEHYVSPEVLTRLNGYLDFQRHCPHEHIKFAENGFYTCDKDGESASCATCSQKLTKKVTEQLPL